MEVLDSTRQHVPSQALRERARAPSTNQVESHGAQTALFTHPTLHHMSKTATLPRAHIDPHQMAPRSALANISFTVDSASEDDLTHDELNALPTPESNTENKAPARKARGKAAQTKAMAPATKAPAKGRTATRRVSASGVKKSGVAKKTGAGRKVLVERENANGSDTEEVEEFEEDEVAAAPAKTTKRGRPAKAQTQDVDMEEAPEPVKAKRGRKPAAKEAAPAKTKAAARGKSAKKVEEPEAHTIPETQPEEPEADEMDVEDSIEVDEIPESMPPPPRPSARRAQAQTSKARQTSAGPRRAGSASDTERDPALRRKVGDLTRKLEAMAAKYETLKDAATAGKESNFDQLKKRTEQIARGKNIVGRVMSQLTLLQTRTQSSSPSSNKSPTSNPAHPTSHLSKKNSPPSPKRTPVLPPPTKP
jgi:hypothetical protein